MCWFYMGIAQIALDPPTLCQTGKRGKKSAQNHPGKPLHPQANVGKMCPKPSWQAFTPPMPIWKQPISKRGI